MRVLVINSGSSTLKFDLIEVAANSHARAEGLLARGLVDRIGMSGPQGATLELHTTSHNGDIPRLPVSAQNHREAVALALQALDTLSTGPVDAVGHRVVHGGSRFVAPTLIDADVLAAVDALSDLAPLHNPGAVAGMKAVREELGPGVPMVAVFDTAFHSTLPEHAYTYALPHDLSRRGEMRRYGFHGTAHEYMLKRYADLRNISTAAATLVTLQLGNGCSAAAIKNGKSVDTSMGFTPLEGLVMGTRSGDVDPGLVGYIAEKEGMSGPEVIDLLNKKAGLLGLSGSTSDMRSLIEALPQQPAARLAVDVFCYRVRKYIGAYLAVLGGARAVIFGGGIGENAALIRARILEDMEWCGLKLSPARNEAVAGKEGSISADDSPVEIYVIRVDESLLIAEHTVALVSGKPGNQGTNKMGL